MSSYYVIGKSNTPRDDKNHMLGNSYNELALDFILKYLPYFGGVNWEKYKIKFNGKVQNFFMDDFIRYYIDNHGIIVAFDDLIKEDFNRVAASIFKGKKEFEALEPGETYISFMQNFFPEYTDTKSKFAWQESLDEVETKFKLDPRYDPNWIYDMNSDNNQEVLITCYNDNQD